MSIQVKKAVFNLITSIIIMGGYAYYMFVIKAQENLPLLDEPSFWGKFILIMTAVMIVSKIILIIIFMILLKMRNQDEDAEFTDERDKLIEMKSDRNGNYFFFIGLLCAMIPIAMGYSIQYMFIILICAGFIAGSLGDLWKIYYYRKGI